MKTVSFVMSVMIALWFAMVVGVAGASDTGAGVCVLGTGASLNDPAGAGPYAGVNVADPTLGNSETGVYDNAADYETQCCAETGQEPDCFEPVQ